MKIEPGLNTHTNAPLDASLKTLKECSSKSFALASPIPPVINHSIHFYNHEQDRIFNQEWICIGRCDEIESAGDFLTHQIAGTSVLVIRQDSGEIISFINACAHRFTCLSKERSGHAFAFTCPNHAWTYGLDGQLKHAPFMEMKSNFITNDHKLERLHTEIWEGFIYVTLSKKPKKSIAKSLDGLRKNIVGQYDMANYKTVIRESMFWNANWKNLIENFTESYHMCRLLIQRRLQVIRNKSKIMNAVRIVIISAITLLLKNQTRVQVRLMHSIQISKESGVAQWLIFASFQIT